MSTLNSEPNCSFDELDSGAIALRILHLRNDILKMTQAEFAFAINISQTYLSMIENGRKEINKQIADSIIVNFNVSIKWFLFGMGTDDDIFLSDTFTQDYFKNNSIETALSTLKNSYSLKAKDMEFIKWFISLPKSDREKFISCLNGFTDVTKSFP